MFPKNASWLDADLPVNLQYIEIRSPTLLIQKAMFKSTDEANLTMFEEDSEQPLMDANESDFLNEAERRRMLYNNFLIMCVAFSFNHGCVVSCLAYASTELGDQLGAYGSGTLYIAYSLSAFVLAKPIVEMVGPKFGLIFGVLGFCLYVMGFLLSVAVPSVAWPVFMIASIFGGVSGGLLWTAQGKYFSVNAILYAEALDIPVEDVNTQFAGIFAATYLGLEMLTNMIATGVYFGIEENANAVVFSLYAMIALLSCICMGAISNLDEYGSWELDMADTAVHMGATLALLREDLRLLLMVPTQVSFGLVTSFVPYYIFGTVIADSGNLGEEYVGVLAAVAVFAGAAVAIPAAHLAQRNGKHSVMILGGLCFAVTGIVLYFVKNHPLDRWRIIIPYLIVYGIGRGIWENTNKAVIADLYINDPDQATAAFAAVSFTSGLSGAGGYFMFASIMRSVSATLIFTVALFGVVCYLNVTMMEERRLSTVRDPQVFTKLQ